MITKKQRLRIRKEFSTKKPTVWIGKNGITEEFIGNLLKQFEKNEVVKIKILKSFLKTHSVIEITEKIIKQTDSILIEIRGHSFILFRKRKT
ncbi:YhbY family RNA-binding protein [Candidatus Bathyarchaeota archaeon]|nr:YhbY family RNA-binding protein [Candidatus Bathyarchaeota archaeon]